MSTIINNTSNVPSPILVPPMGTDRRTLNAVPPGADRTFATDTVEFSPFARRLAHAMNPSSFRLARLRAIREQIENGAFETPARLEGTVRRLLPLLLG